MLIENAAESKKNLQNLLNDGVFKDRVINALDKLYKNNQLNNFAAEDQNEIANKEKGKHIFKKTSGLLIGGGLAVGGLITAMTAAQLALPAVMAISAVASLGGLIKYAKSIQIVHTKNSMNADSAERNARNSERDAKNAAMDFNGLTFVASEAINAYKEGSPEANKKMIDLEKKLSNIESRFSYMEESNKVSISNMTMKDESKKGFFNKLENALKIKSENKNNKITKSFKPN